MTSGGAPSSVVVVGSGAAGICAAEALRRNGYREPITIVGDEPDAPYDRPPLSKQVLSGSWELEKARLLSERRHERIGADWLLGCRAVSLDVDARLITTDDGRRLRYGATVLATGVRPRTLPTAEHEGVHVLRTGADALALKARLEPETQLVVVGAGFLGLEVAATARSLGVHVTVVEPMPTPLANRLGSIAADRLLQTHREHGVGVICGVGVKAVAGRRPGSPCCVELTDRSLLDADTVLIAIGCSPNLEWLSDSGLGLEDGIVCDDRCQAAPGVWAAGDVARWMHPVLGRHVRLEHRMNATEQGQAAARAILGSTDAFAPLPFFWTDQYDVRIQVWGEVPEGGAAELHGDDADDDSFVVAFRRNEGGPLVGALGWNAAARLPRFRDEIAAGWEASRALP